MNGYSQLAVIVWIALTAAALLGLAAGLLLYAAVRHLLAWSLDERDEIRAERRTSREVPPC